MRTLLTLTNAVTRLNDWLGRWVAYLVLAMFALLILEVGLRYILRAPTVWTNELAQMLFGAYAVLAGGYLLAHNAHVNVDIIYSRFPRRARAAVDIVTSILLFLFAWVLLTQGGSLAWESLERLEHSQSAWNPPLWPVKLTLPIAAGLLLLQGVVKLIHDILALLGLDADAGDEHGGRPE